MSPSSRSRRAPKRASRPPARAAHKAAPKTRPKPPAPRFSGGKSRPTPAKAAKPVAKPAAKSPPKAPTKTSGKGSAAAAPPVEPPRSPLGREHVLSLSFLRDGDEFLARLETDAGQITELKNRSLDQLLTLVAGELEDLLE